MACKQDTTGLLTIGIFTIAIGVALLLSQLGIISWSLIWHWWPVVFIFGGISRLTSASRNGDRAWGVSLIIIGALLIAHEFGRFPLGLQHLWPLFIIAGGISLLWHAFDGRRAVEDSGVDLSSPDVKASTVFGSTERIVRTKALKGGKLSAVFGEVKLDLTQSEMEGDVAVINAEVVFGSSEIRVPPTWTVDVRGDAVFGAYEDKTYRGFQDDSSPKKTLLITGATVFGSVQIRN